MPAGFNLLSQRNVKSTARHNAARLRYQADGYVPALRWLLLCASDTKPPRRGPDQGQTRDRKQLSAHVYQLRPASSSNVVMTVVIRGRYLKFSSKNLALITPCVSRTKMIGLGTP